MPYSRAEALTATRRRSTRRRIYAAIRDTYLLVREFQLILIIFVLTLLVAAWSFRILWNIATPEMSIRFIDALYFVMTLLFFEPTLDFPETWYLDMYFFIMPVIGLIFLTLGVADFAILLFNRQARQDQWEVSVVSIMSNHIVVVGLGHVGIRVVRELIVLDQDVVIVQNEAREEHFEEARGYDIPIIVGDGRRLDVLEKAGLQRASAVILCTGDDLANLQMASLIREQRPDVRLVVRMFNDQFARSMAAGLGLDAVISSSALAAPAFAGAAAGTEIIQTFTVEDRVLAMGRIVVRENTRLDGSSVHDVESQLEVSLVLLHAKDGHVDIEPEGDYTLQPGDVIALVAEIPALQELSRQWNSLNGDEESTGLLGGLFRRRST